MNEFRIYSVALSSDELAATEMLGPNRVLSTESPLVGVATSGSNLVVSWPVASAGFTLQSRTNLVVGNRLNVTSPAPQIVSGQWRVTMPFANTANSTFYRLMK